MLSNTVWRACACACAGEDEEWWAAAAAAGRMLAASVEARLLAAGARRQPWSLPLLKQLTWWTDTLSDCWPR